MFKMIQKCRICDNPDLDFVYSLGHIAISNFTKRPAKGVKYPLVLVYCAQCTLLQLGHNIPRSVLYRNYWYRSSVNAVIRQDLSNIVHEAQKYVKSGWWIDIGANDGTLLSYVNKGKFFRIGVDPAVNLSPELKSNSEISMGTYFEKCNFSIKAQVITAIACLYDLPDPNKFMTKIKSTLADDGIFISQLMTLEPMIENNDLGNICHEHLEYYSYNSLVWLFEKNGLEIFKVEKNKINGGSYRLYARHFKKGSVRVNEKTYTKQDYNQFFSRIDLIKEKMQEFLSLHNISGYGASTKGNTILQYYKAKLPVIYEKNSEKFGLYTVGTKTPIVSDKKLDSETEYLWVLPWGFVENFKEREAKWRANGGKFIVVSPEFKVI